MASVYSHDSGSRTPTLSFFQAEAPLAHEIYPSGGTCVFEASTRMSKNRATSRLDLANGPAVSNLRETGTMPRWPMMVCVTFKVYSAARSAGKIKDPEVSSPNAMGAYPAATAIEGPEDDPPGPYT